MATATKFMKFSWLFCFRKNSSFTNSAQFSNDSNYSKFNGEDIATNCPRVTVLTLDGLTKNALTTMLSWTFFPSDHQEVTSWYVSIQQGN